MQMILALISVELVAAASRQGNRLLAVYWLLVEVYWILNWFQRRRNK